MRPVANKKGMTLIELVIVIAILGIVLSVVTMIITFASNFFLGENSQIERQQNIRYVAVRLEKDIRKSSQNVTVANGCILVDAIEYCLSSNEVKRDDTIIAKDIAVFDVTMAADGTYMDLSIVSTPDKRGDTVAIATRIYLRKGD